MPDEIIADARNPRVGPVYVKATLRGDRIEYEGTPSYLAQLDPIDGRHGKIWTIRAGWQVEPAGLNIFSDRLGLVPLFVHQQREQIVVSNSLLAVARITGETELDDDAMSIFVRLGFFLGEDTPLKNIRVLPPAQSAIWSGRPQLWNHLWQLSTPSQLTRQQATIRYAELVRASIRRRTTGVERTGLPLSSGRDSRHIAYELARAGRLPTHSLTIRTEPPHGDEDVRGAQAIAKQLGFHHEVIEVDYRRLVDREQEKNRLTHFLSDEHTWFLLVSSALCGRVTRMFDGLGGDVLGNGLFFHPELLAALRRRDTEAAADNILQRRGRPPDWLAADRHEVWTRKRAQDRLQHELQNFLDAPNPIQAFFFANRTRREVALAPVCMSTPDVEVSLPFLDEDVWSFLTRLPAEEFGPPGFHDEVIAAEFPESLTIPYGRKDLSKCLPRRVNRQIAQGIARFVWQHRRAPALKRQFVWPRTMRAIFTGDGWREQWWLVAAVHLCGMERALGGE